MKRKWLRLAALGMAVVLTGCQNSSPATGADSAATDNETKTESGAASGAQETGGNGNFNPEGLPIVKEKETFTIAVPQTSTLKTAAEKQCVIETEEATNIHIEWIEIPASGWEEKINIMFSTDSLPDAILGDVDMSRNFDQLVALDEYLEQYAPNVTAFFDTRDDYPNALRSPDGKVHTLPVGDESTHNIIDSHLWINQTWLDNLSLKMPETPEELKEVLIAFRDQDPNGNGKKDEIPFTFQDSWGWGTSIENIFGPFGVLENGYHVITQDGKVTFSAKEQGYYEALAWLHDLYQEGLIDKDAFTLSADQYAARGASGDILGLVAGYRAEEAGITDESEYRALPVLKGKDGTQMIGINNVTRAGGFAISKSCKNPEALVRWYDYINSSLELALKWGRGAEGVWWNILEENGEEIPQFLTMDNDVLAANGGYQSKAEYRNAESFSGKTPSLWRYEYDQKLVYDDKWPHDDKLEAVREQTKFGVVGLPAGMAVSLENTERRSILMTDIDTYLKKFIADSVINGIDEGKWEEHLKTLESLKVDEYTQLCQEFVDSVK